MGPDKYYVKDLKKAYRILRKEKNQYPKGDEKRIELHRQMKELKEKIKKCTPELNPEKQTIIDKILSYYHKENRGLPAVSLESFTVEELEFHYYKITGKVRTREDYKKMKEATTKSGL